MEHGTLTPVMIARNEINHKGRLTEVLFDGVILTLPSNTSIASNADPLAHPIGNTTQLTPIRAPAVLLLPLVLEVIVLTGDERGQDDPFRDGRPMNTRRGRYCDVAVSDNWMVDPVVYAGGEEVNEFKAEGIDSSAKVVRKL